MARPKRWRNYAEAELQKQCVAYFRAKYPRLSRLLVYVNNNAGNPAAGHRNKLLGTVRGFPDVFLFVGNASSLGLAIEFKRGGEKPRPEQREIHELLILEGYQVEVIDSFADFKELIADYLKKSENS